MPTHGDFVHVELNEAGRAAATQIADAFKKLRDTVGPLCYSGSHWARCQDMLEDAQALAMRASALDPVNQVDQDAKQRTEDRRAAGERLRAPEPTSEDEIADQATRE